MLKYSDLFGSGGSAILGPTLATNFFESRTWTAPQDGIVIVRGMGAGGGGAYQGTGGYSGSWGAKIVRVKKGDAINVAIGAGGVSNGGAGGNTTITISGVDYIAYGGPGGVNGATVAPPNGPAPSSNWDFGAASVKPGWVDSTTPTGGAGVDILAQGNNATTSASVASSGGGGTGGPSVGMTGGGAMPGGKSALGSGITFDASQGEWGVSFYGGSSGGNGGGGSGGNSGPGGGGGNGGGGGSSSSGSGYGGAGGYGGNGGIGGGGGGGGTGYGGAGGHGFAHLKFFADMGV